MQWYSIPPSAMGQTLEESSVKAALRGLNPGIHFDMGNALGMWHPYMATRQNVYYQGESVVAMDRRILPEVPVWSMTKEMVEVQFTDIRVNEIAMYGHAGVVAQCLKCHQRWELPHRPAGLVICPALCENMGQPWEADRFVFSDKPTQTAHVMRDVRDRIILVGWRHTFRGVLKRAIPGVTKEALEAKLGINLDRRIIEEHEEVEVSGAGEEKMLDQSVSV